MVHFYTARNPSTLVSANVILDNLKLFVSQDLYFSEMSRRYNSLQVISNFVPVLF